MSNSPASTIVPGINHDKDRARELLKKADRFRILVIGRANSGKTTILQKICKTDEKPEIFNSKSEKINVDAIEPSAKTIENEIIFRSNRGFVFHNSCGFEAGDTNKLDDVIRFIKQRAKERKLPNQIHAIWYCIPMDSPRPFTEAEKDFFSKVRTGKVPVIAIFTKFDACNDEALKSEGLSPGDAAIQAPSRAMLDFQNSCKDLPIFKSNYPPKAVVILRDMNSVQSHCNELVKETAAALDGKILQTLFVSTQRNQMALCFQYAIQDVVMNNLARRPKLEHIFSPGTITFEVLLKLAAEISCWFPITVVGRG